MALKAGGVTRWTRSWIALQVGALLLLALVATVLIVDLAQWAPLRVRQDWTLRGRNSLSAVTREQLEALPGKATIDIFFRAVGVPGDPLNEVGFQAQALFQDLVFVATKAAPDKLEAKSWQLDDPAAVERRMLELRLADVVNKVVVSLGEQRVVLSLVGDLCEIDPGERDARAPRPPSLRSFRGEEALAQALERVSIQDRPRLLFTTGHGELDLEGQDESGLGQLALALRDEGFRLETWDGKSAIPADTAVIASLGAAQPFAPNEYELLRHWIEAGGSFFGSCGALYSDAPLSVVALLGEYGMRGVRGIVCQPVRDPATGQRFEGLDKCAALVIDRSGFSPQMPITRPLWQNGRRLVFSFVRSFERGNAPQGGVLLDLVSSGGPSPDESWRDLQLADGSLDYAFDSAREELGRFRLAMAAEFPGRGEEQRQARVVGLLAPYVLANQFHAYNRDFLLNCFQWLGKRESRIKVSARDPLEGRVDVERSDVLSNTARVAWYGLPGVCVLLGVLLSWSRRR